MQSKLFAVAFVALIAVAMSASNVVVKNQRLYVDGTEFFIKGVVYNPVPLGQSLMSASGTGGKYSISSTYPSQRSLTHII